MHRNNRLNLFRVKIMYLEINSNDFIEIFLLFSQNCIQSPLVRAFHKCRFSKTIFEFILLSVQWWFFWFLKILYYLLFQTGEVREKGRERNINGWLPHIPSTGDLPCNTRMCPDWESNHRHFRLEVNPLRHTSQGLCFNF